MPGLQRRQVVAMAILSLCTGSTSVAASQASRRRAARIHERRDLERRQPHALPQTDGQAIQQRSRAIPPTGAGSQTVPNR